MDFRIALIEGDGVGPEVISAARAVMDTASKAYGFGLHFEKLRAGDGALSEVGSALPESTRSKLYECHSCLKGPVGRTASDVIVRLRRELDLFANIRPAKTIGTPSSSVGEVDMVIVRENTEDLYTGMEFELADGAVAMKVITAHASRRIAEYAARLALSRNRERKITCVQKSNVLHLTDGLFARTCRETVSSYPDIRYEEMLVDAAAMNIVRRPSSFDVIVTENLYGDILSDEAAEIAGGIGLSPSANIGERYSIFEPVHGAAFDIAGSNTVNPTAAILSGAMMIRYLGEIYGGSDCIEAANAIEVAVKNCIVSGKRTADLGGNCSTSEFGRNVAMLIRNGSR
ncbi:MAG: isocitrate/isopropylmalate dehydrogenase family protein [Thermoplasmata archaeon YP2-bin.285]|uniref:Isocitrate/isopropylmalate dehydrogenase family protein n=3 Tax=Candidatus Sysuiplasma superficiale TaxID=2823368 RepID=A0A8J7YPH1_9ARCH|nr:isocitrate/isopropylmalate dehydrogenase family protein [Candidatus Sysuiplasma superficiale]